MVRPPPARPAGFRAVSRERVWRLGLAYSDGQVPIGDFFQVDERYLILGVWLDLERVTSPAGR